MSFSIYEIAAVEPGAGKALEKSPDPVGKGGDFASVMGVHDGAGLTGAEGSVVNGSEPVVAQPAEPVESGDEATLQSTVAEADGDEATDAFDGGSVDPDLSDGVVEEGVPEGEAIVSEESGEPVPSHAEFAPVTAHAEEHLRGIENAILKIESKTPEATGKALEVLTDGPAGGGGSGYTVHPNGGVPANANIEMPIVPDVFTPLASTGEAAPGDLPPLEDAQVVTEGGGGIGSGALSRDNVGPPLEGLSSLNGEARPAPATEVTKGGPSNTQGSHPQATSSGASPSEASTSTMYGYELLDKVGRALGELVLSARVDGKQQSAKASAPMVHVKDVPGDLGEIILKLDGESKGLKIVVESAAVKALLESDPGGLRTLLAGKGMGSYSIEIALDAPGTPDAVGTGLSELSPKGSGGPSMPVVTLPTDDVVRAASAVPVSERPGNVVVATSPPTGTNARAAEAARAGLAVEPPVHSPVQPTVQPTVQTGMAEGRSVDAPPPRGGERTYGIDNAVSKISVNAPEPAENALRVLTDGPAAEVLRAVTAVEAAVRMAGAAAAGNVSKGAAVNGSVQAPPNPGVAANPDGTLNPGGTGDMGGAFNPGGAEADVSTAFGNGGNGSFAPGENGLKYDNAGRLIESIMPLSRGSEVLFEAGVKEGSAKAAPIPDAHRFEVFQKLGRGLRMSIAGGGKEVRVKLVPSHLGEIILKVSIEENNVSAKIMVENMAVKGLLESDAGRLKALFSENGLELDDYSVEVGSHGSRSNDESPWLNARGDGLDPSAQRGEDKDSDDEVQRLPFMPYGEIGPSSTGSLDLFA